MASLACGTTGIPQAEIAVRRLKAYVSRGAASYTPEASPDKGGAGVWGMAVALSIQESNLNMLLVLEAARLKTTLGTTLRRTLIFVHRNTPNPNKLGMAAPANSS